MNVDGLRELDEMAAKLEATIHKLPQVKRDELLRDIERIRAQVTALLAASEKVSEQLVDLGVKAKSK
jgi:hypothetical protein